ncbi:MAG TPA: hypothetical protein VK906_12185 [Egicoccus sp.]|nr:hypothetical protein [Egicoccus sp.]HSK23933.1 hypothetical protein [Egicoccus sp.]
MSTTPTVERRTHAVPNPSTPPSRTRTVGRIDEEDGSLVTEYGLLAIVAATIAGIVISWAQGGAVVQLFNALLSAARGLVGA